MYDEKAKDRTMRYLKEKRDKLTLNLPLGAKDRYKLHAESKGKSLTGLIVELLEEDIKKDTEPEPTKEEPPGGYTPIPNILYK